VEMRDQEEGGEVEGGNVLKAEVGLVRFVNDRNAKPQQRQGRAFQMV
jgi:hypothetical protein